MQITGAEIHVMGLAERTAGFHPNVDNLPPSTLEIVNLVKARFFS